MTTWTVRAAPSVRLWWCVGMIARSRLAVTFDQIDTTTELAELAKMSAKTGADLTVEHYEDEHNRPRMRATLTRTATNFIVNDVASLVYMQAMTRDKTPAAVLDEVRAKLEGMHITLDRSPSDGQGIAE